MNVSGGMALRMLAKGAWNAVRKYPLSVSFEVTHTCTANCWHCNWGGPIKETRRTPEEYAAICRELKPVVVNVSGGEPMARGDLDDIVRGLSRPGRLPWVVVVSNGSQLSPERFLRLKRAGMHQLSLSIDFPDERHDDGAAREDRRGRGAPAGRLSGLYLRTRPVEVLQLSRR
jgi:MoaA/NifB/PqqE/SkfB family radical SAM enzyme